MDFCLVQIPYELPVAILQQTLYDFLEEKNQLLEKRALFCCNNWVFDLALLIVVTNHLYHLSMKLQGKNNFFPNLVNDIIAFNKRYKCSFRS